MHMQTLAALALAAAVAGGGSLGTLATPRAGGSGWAEASLSAEPLDVRTAAEAALAAGRDGEGGSGVRLRLDLDGGFGGGNLRAAGAAGAEGDARGGAFRSGAHAGAGGDWDVRAGGSAPVSPRGEARGRGEVAARGKAGTRIEAGAPGWHLGLSLRETVWARLRAWWEAVAGRVARLSLRGEAGAAAQASGGATGTGAGGSLAGEAGAAGGARAALAGGGSGGSGGADVSAGGEVRR